MNEITADMIQEKLEFMKGKKFVFLTQAVYAKVQEDLDNTDSMHIENPIRVYDAVPELGINITINWISASYMHMSTLYWLEEKQYIIKE